MLSFLYPISFLASLTGLILWFYFREHPMRSRRMSQLFLGGFLIYALTLAFADASLSYKILILARDLFALAGITVVFSLFRRIRYLFVGLLAMLYLSFPFLIYPWMMQTFPQERIEASNYDPEGELLLEMAEGHSAEEVGQVLKDYQLDVRPAFSPEQEAITDLDDYFVVDVPANFERKLGQIMRKLKKEGFVESVEINDLVKVEPITSRLPSPIERKYGIDDPGLEYLWGFDKMAMDQLYDFLRKKSPKPRKKALVAILDTGVDSQHEDLAGNYLSKKRKYDSDPNGHGTHCAGIAAAVSNNGKGIASYSPDNSHYQVTSFRVLNYFGGGSQASVIRGMLEAIDAGADVLSMSLGYKSRENDGKTFSKVVEYANKKNAIIVCAAGNNNDDAQFIAPANTPGVIVVSAVDDQLGRAFFSNYVSNLEWGIAAPGVNVYSTYPKNKYQSSSGTSMATPYVAGLAGLMKSLDPDLTAEEVYKILYKTGKKTKATQETGRLIQPAAAIEEVLKLK